jgi:hypothetical protein
MRRSSSLMWRKVSAHSSVSLADLKQGFRVLTRHPRTIFDVPTYVHDRKGVPLESRRPWWNYHATAYVERMLPDRARVFEFGSGGSTLWFVDHGAEITSLEHSSDWAALVQEACPGLDLISVESDQTGTVRSVGEPSERRYFDAYLDVMSAQPDETFDLVAVDGRCRCEAGIISMPKIKPGGMLLLDDSQRPRYRPLHEHLSANGWAAEHLVGLKAGRAGWVPVQTSVWAKPVGRS